MIQGYDTASGALKWQIPVLVNGQAIPTDPEDHAVHGQRQGVPRLVHELRDGGTGHQRLRAAVARRSHVLREGRRRKPAALPVLC